MLAQTACLTRCYGSLIVVALSAAVCQGQSDSVTLEYRFQQGQTVSYSVDNQSQVYLQEGQVEQHIEHGSLSNKRYTVQSIDADGNAVLELQIDRVRMSASVDGGKTVEYDTDSGDEPPAEFRGIADTIGKPHVRIKVSPQGELLSIDWLIGNDTGPKPTKDDAADLDIMVVLPEGPIKIGETWKQQFETEVAATPKLKKRVKLQREYTLKKVDGGRATIALKTVVLTPLHDPAQESQLIAKTPKGEIEFDLNEGIVVSRKMTVDKTVVGFNGPNSKVHSTSQRLETRELPQVAADAPGTVR